MTEVPGDISRSLLLDALQRITALAAQVSNLQGQANIIIREQERAAEGRKAMYEKLSRFDLLEARVSRLTPLVEAHEQRHQRGLGAIWLARTVWAASAGSVGAMAAMAASWLTGKGH